MTQSKCIKISKTSSADACDLNHDFDIRHLAVLLYEKKLTLVFCVILFSSVGMLFAIFQPNIYQSSATFRVVENPYLDDQMVSRAKDISNPISFLSSDVAKKSIAQMTGQLYDEFNDLSIRLDRDGNIYVAKQSLEPEKALYFVDLYIKNINSLFKDIEMRKVAVALKATKSLIDEQHGKVQEALGEKYAQLLYKQAMLRSSESEFINIISEPKLPTNHVRPKRVLIVSIGVLFGGVVGLAYVLFCSAFGRKKIV